MLSYFLVAEAGQLELSDLRLTVFWYGKILEIFDYQLLQWEFYSKFCTCQEATQRR